MTPTNELRITLAAAREREISAALASSGLELMRTVMDYPQIAESATGLLDNLREANSWEQHLGQIDALIKLAEAK